MNPCKRIFVYAVLLAFLLSTLGASSNSDWQHTKTPDAASAMNLEDVEDVSDLEDSPSEDEDDTKEPANSQHQITRHYISMIILHQMQIFRSHQPTIVSPPPKAS